MQRKDRFGVRRLVTLALFAAFAYAVAFAFRINVSFLTFDAKDAIICIAAMILGPAAGPVVSLLVTLIEQITVGDTGFWGWLMDFISTSTFSVIAAYIYSKRRHISGVAIALTAAVVSTVTVMMICNLVITPIYMKVDVEQVVAFMPTLLLPFNLTKSVLNAGIVLALYKPLVTALRASRLIPKSENVTSGEKKSFWSIRSLIFVLIAILLISASVVYMIFGLGGHFEFT